jgi:DNA repair protein RadC
MRGLRIREMAPEERPRERLIRLGSEALSDAELIAILLRTGIEGANAIDVARQLLEKFHSLTAIARCSAKELAEIKGIGQTKALHLVAAFGLGDRLAREKLSRRKIDSPELVYDLLGYEMRMLQKESLRVILLDTRYHLKRIEQVSLGSLNESIAHPREVFKPAFVHSAHSLIVVHNHPSGDPAPSESDYRLTRRLSEAAQLLQINLLDHIIIGSPRENGPPYFSFKEAGVL